MPLTTLRQLPVTSAALTACLALFAGCNQGPSPGAPDAAAPPPADPGPGLMDAGLAHMRAHALAYGIGQRFTDLSPLGLVLDRPLGLAHARLQQVVGGVPVFGGQAIVHMQADGTVVQVTNTLVPGVAAPPAPVLTEEEAIARAIELFGCRDCLTAPARATLTLLRHQDRDRLSYMVELRRLDGSAASAMPVIFIDALDGAEVWRYDNLQTVAGTGLSLYSGTVDVEAYQSPASGAFFLEDVGRKLGTFTYQNTLSALSPFEDSDNVWDASAQRAGVDAHYGAHQTMDYYLAVHGRNAIDGLGGPFLKVGQDGITALITSGVHYGSGFNNAFWDGLQMTYGDGDGVTFGSFTALEVCGHEMTHGVTAHSANLIYANESGALNEATSDILGAMVERFTRGESANTWRLGEEFFTPGTPGDAGRYMDHPHLAVEKGFTADDDPDHYSERYLGSFDNGGVHINSGIANHAFYLMAKGGAHHLAPADTILPEGAPPGPGPRALGADKAEAIWYRALTTRWTASTGFAKAADELVNAAADLYGAGSPESRTVAKAWALVGVRVDLAPPTTAITSPPAGATLGHAVTVTATAGDDTGVSAVELYVDGHLRATDVSAPYELLWQTGLDGNGPHLLTTRALDRVGHFADSAPVAVIVENELTPPTVSIEAPADGATVAGQVVVTAAASDDGAVAQVQVYAGDTLVGTALTPPWQVTWDSTTLANGETAVLTAKAYDLDFNVGESSPVTVTVQNPFAAAFDATLGAPACTTVEAGCDSYRLLQGRGALGPEPHGPNTLGGDCADDEAGAFHAAESLDRLRVTTLGGEPLATGRPVQIEATVWVSDPAQDRLDLYHAPEATGPVWSLLATLTPTARGAQVLSTTFVLPLGTRQAIRGVFRRGGSPALCAHGGRTDRDDLVFAVANPPDGADPVASVTAPADGATVAGTVAVEVAASDDVGLSRVELLVDGAVVDRDLLPPYEFAWDTHAVANGSHLLAARARDFAGKTGTSAALAVTVDNDVTPPLVALTAPAEGATVTGAVTVNAEASDDRGVTRVELYVDGTLRDTDTSAPYTFVWDTRDRAPGPAVLAVKAFDAENHQSSASVTVVVDQPSAAVFDTTLQVPRCPTARAACDTFDLVVGRGSVSPGEPHAPNTIKNSCSDGSGGRFHVDESLDRLRVSSLDGGPLTVGQPAKIEATVWVSNAANDALDLYYARDAASPAWTYLTTLTSTGTGQRTLSATYTLPFGSVQAVRGTWRFAGFPSSCSFGFDDDRDDLVFAVAPPPVDADPTAVVTAPASGAALEGFVQITAAASDDFGVAQVDLLIDGVVLGTALAPPYQFFWDTRALPNGPHTLTARARDLGGKTGVSPPVVVTVNNDVTPPAVAITAPVDGARVSGQVTISASASDDRAVTRVELYIGGVLSNTLTAPPYQVRWDARLVPGGPVTIMAKAFDAVNHESSASVTVTVDQPFEALFDPALQVPACAQVKAACDTLALVSGRGSAPPAEPHAPNTINGSCPDGNGTIHRSLDRLRVGTLDGSPMGTGKTVKIEATVWTFDPSFDQLDLYFASDATSPSWTFLTTKSSSSSGARTLTATYTLPPGALQAVRANWRFGGSATPCSAGSVDDRDDLVFAVQNDSALPTVALEAPVDGATLTGNPTLAALASDDVGVAKVEFYVNGALAGTATAPPWQIVWDASEAADGTATVTAVATDFAGKQGLSVPVTVTVASPFRAVFDPALRAPSCAAVDAGCDSYRLARGRGPLGPEPNSPNTLNGVCPDGTSGTFHASESLDRLRLTTVDGTPLAAGKEVRIEATVWASAATDRLDLYHAPSTTSQAWKLLATLTPAGTGQQVLSTTFVLPAGHQQVLHGNFRASASPSTCSPGSRDDRDDLVFAVTDAPPTIAITAPADGAVVSGFVIPQASASDDEGISQVDFLLDGMVLASRTFAPYSFSWDTTQTANGRHTLVARARDVGGNSTLGPPVTVTVSNDRTPPTVAIVAPAPGAIVALPVTVDVEATDDFGVTQVDLVVGDVVQAIATAPPYRFVWPGGGRNGPTALTVRAFDAVGHQSTSSVIVTLDTRAPTAAIGAPASNAFLRGRVQVAAQVLDDVGVHHVDLLADGAVVATRTEAPYIFDWDTAAGDDGVRTLTVRAVDFVGLAGESAPVAVIVDNTPPTAVLTAPAPGAKLGGDVVVTAQSADAQSGLVEVVFLLDGQETVHQVSPPFSWAFDAGSLAPGPHTLGLRARDAAGNVGAAEVPVDVPGPQSFFLEAEGGAVLAPMKVIADAKASGGKYVAAPAGTNSSSVPPPDGRTRLTFTTPAAGTYKVWARVAVPSTSQDSFWVRVDGGTAVKWNAIAPGTAFHWADAGNSDAGGAEATFALGAGSHTLDVAYREGGAKLDRVLVTSDLGLVPVDPVTMVWPEAEAATLTAPLVAGSDALASGGRFISVTTGPGSTTAVPAGGHATWTFTVATGGTHRVWGRVIAPSTASDSFYLRVDGGSWMTWNNIPLGSAWHWASAASFTLAPGSHTLELAYREINTRLDRVLVTSDLSFTPAGKGP